MEKDMEHDMVTGNLWRPQRGLYDLGVEGLGLGLR